MLNSPTMQPSPRIAMPLSRRDFLGLGALVCLTAAGVFHVAPARADANRWSAFGDDYPALQFASEAAVADEDGNVLFSLNGDVSMAMASTTKIMTAVVALESGVSLDTV